METRRARGMPLLVVDGDTGCLITVVLRPGTSHAGHRAQAIRKRIFGS
jgi:hypothetical protein